MLWWVFLDVRLNHLYIQPIPKRVPIPKIDRGGILMKKQAVSVRLKVIFVFCLLITLVIGGCKTNPSAVPKNSVEPVYSVVSPLGDSTVKMITMAPRLNTLAGKTVCMVWNHAFKADITLPAIAESLKNKYPDIKIVPYTEIDAAIRAAGRESASTEAATLQAVLKEKGCDAVISGNGG